MGCAATTAIVVGTVGEWYAFDVKGRACGLTGSKMIGHKWKRALTFGEVTKVIRTAGKPKKYEFQIAVTKNSKGIKGKPGKGESDIIREISNKFAIRVFGKHRGLVDVKVDGKWYSGCLNSIKFERKRALFGVLVERKQHRHETKIYENEIIINVPMSRLREHTNTSLAAIDDGEKIHNEKMQNYYDHSKSTSTCRSSKPTLKAIMKGNR
mmetsp:Transcript_18082/g.27121  ORF Transcript_18082/g.27121 Transcript_18082/m.27121 type:complete len:210 (+) Transcript_18082:311-940(+)